MSQHTQPASLLPSSRPAPPAPSHSPLHPFWLAVAFGVFLFLGWMFLAGLWRFRFEWVTTPGHRYSALLYVLSLDAFALTLSAAFLCALEGSQFRALGLSFSPRWLLQSGVGFASGAAVVSVTAALLSVSHAARLAPFASHSFSRFLFLSVFLLLAAAFEELTFRGYALQRVADSVGPVLAALLSSVLFGWAHMANPQASLLSAFNTALAGGLLAVARLRSRALWMPIGLHFAWNLFLGPVFGLAVSGYSFGVGGRSVPAPGLAWYSGGAYGPEGGLALTFVVAAAILLLLRIPLPASSLRPPSDVD
ncbi:MAG TPA: type II CAAX endopeptidase family protein [Candidatus Acidoferrales bacterium]|nr:type II CAAX endopeptidase family protein [Candidatus Acidoferrales bacterium]